MSVGSNIGSYRYSFESINIDCWVREELRQRAWDLVSFDDSMIRLFDDSMIDIGNLV